MINSKLKNGAVTPNKLGAESVLNSKIAKKAVTSAKLGEEAVTAGKIGREAISAAKIQASLYDQLVRTERSRGDRLDPLLGRQLAARLVGLRPRVRSRALR